MKAHQLVSEFYGTRCALRSKVPLINHINEGLLILDALGEGIDTKQAWCLHPLLQADFELTNNWAMVCAQMQQESPAAIMLAMEYRSVANNFLSDRIVTTHHPVPAIQLSPIEPVNNMLIADKVQNRKDFITYHLGTHHRSAELDLYFSMWLKALGVTEDDYTRYTALLNSNAAPSSVSDAGTTLGYPTFDDWFNEIESYSHRSERFYDHLQHTGDSVTVAKQWMKAAFAAAREQN